MNEKMKEAAKKITDILNEFGLELYPIVDVGIRPKATPAPIDFSDTESKEAKTEEPVSAETVDAESVSEEQIENKTE